MTRRYVAAGCLTLALTAGLMAHGAVSTRAVPKLSARPVAAKPAPVSEAACDRQLDAYASQCAHLITQRWMVHQSPRSPEQSTGSRIRVMITPSGQIAGIHLIKGSGLAWFDEEALAVVRSVGSLPKGPACHTGSLGLTVSLMTRVSKVRHYEQVESSDPDAPAPPEPPLDPASPVQPSFAKPVTLTPSPAKTALPDRTLAQRAFDAVSPPDTSGRPASAPAITAVTVPPPTYNRDACKAEMQTYQESVVEQVRRRVLLPPFTADLSAQLDMFLSQQGHLQTVTVLQPSGDERLDQEIVKGAWAAAPFGPLPVSCGAVKSIRLSFGFAVTPVDTPVLNRVGNKLRNRIKVGPSPMAPMALPTHDDGRP